ncbi:MAG TPA: hypothetical protein VLV28_02510 [Gaiellaceae bacterium]|nr:hypothetical protein [Gaiellaceae bacterium]
MKRLFIVLFGLLLAGVFANQALAEGSYDPGGGYIEVCKAPSAVLTGDFQFTVQDSWGTQTEQITISPTQVSCTAPIKVVPGTVTVTETGALSGIAADGSPGALTTSYLSASWTSVGQFGPGPSGTGFSTDGHITVPAGGPDSTVTVTYTNDPVYGVLEVCKDIVSGSGLSGTWQFAITGGNGFTDTETVAIGACSKPVMVPAGNVKVQETGDLAENVTEIDAVYPGGDSAVVSSNTDTATAVVGVNPGDASNQTRVHFTNDSVRLKLCKWVPADTPTGPYTFTLAASGAPGPNTVTSPITLTAGSHYHPNCTMLGPFRAGTRVDIQENVFPGTKVGSIDVSPLTNLGGGTTVVSGSLSLADRTVSVILGSGETDVSYGNVNADPGTLKICKDAVGTLPVSSFNYTLTPVAPTTGDPITVTGVPVGNCVVVSTDLPFDSTWTVTEAAVTGVAVSDITALPLNVELWCNGVVTATSQLTLTNKNTSAGSANVTISEGGVVTEVHFINSAAGTSPTADSSTSSGSTGSSGTSGSSSSGVATSAETSIPVSVQIPAVLSVSSSTSAISGSTKATVSTATAAKLLKLQSQLKALKASEHKLVLKRSAEKTAAVRKSLMHQIVVLQGKEKMLAASIKLLK